MKIVKKMSKMRKKIDWKLDEKLQKKLGKNECNYNKVRIQKNWYNNGRKLKKISRKLKLKPIDK